MDTPAEVVCLAQVIHHEARGESAAGQEAVAQVVINRKRSPRYPSTICGVVIQPKQFSRFHSRIKASKQAYKIARRVLSYSRPIHSYLYFNTTGPKRAIKIGNHKFW